MVLFGLCKKPPKEFPKSYMDWMMYNNTIKFKVGDLIFTPTEIQHSLLRATMHLPTCLKSFKEYPNYELGNPKGSFKYPIPNPLINFGFYLPFQSNPNLKVFSAENVMEELKEIAKQCFDESEFIKRSKKLNLPAIIEIFDGEFNKKKPREVFMNQIKKCLPQSYIEKYNEKLLTEYVFK